MTEYPDYLLIKDLPGHKAGSRFTMGKNYIYYILDEPATNLKQIIFNPEKDSLVRFNIHTMKSNPDWFLEITKEVEREIKLGKLGV